LDSSQTQKISRVTPAGQKEVRKLSKHGDMMSASIQSKFVWPQSKLKFSHANKIFKFLDLPSFQLLVAGEAACLLDKDMSKSEREARTLLLSETAYLSAKVPWETARDFHYNVMLGVERGERQWGDSTLDIQASIIISSNISVKGPTQSGGSSKYPWSKKTPWTGTTRKWWCAEYQRGT
jgi:hypothetical protein